MPISRRSLLANLSAVGLPLAAARAPRRALAAGATPWAGPILVNLFLRGGADGLALAPPYAEGRYYDLRPRLAIPPPGGGDGACLDLDGFFGLHPAAAPLLPHWQNGTLAVVHAAGNPSDSHSHFASQDYMERGRAGQTADASGWLGRHLATRLTGNPSPFRAVAIGTSVQASLLGGQPPIALADVESFTLEVRRADPAALREAILALYADPAAALDGAVAQAFAAADALAGVAAPGGPGAYPASPLGESLQTLALLLKANLGVEVASVDAGGWDHHANLPADVAARAGDLASALSAFLADLGELSARVTVLVMTEFGRRAYENASLGTDHGHGGIMLALGAGVNGGRVYHDWPGLDAGQLYGAGDLEVTTDYRRVLGELVDRRLGNPAVAAVFPDYAMPAYAGIFR
jgi:uncharacterized protein (DUF1501 family)